MESPDEMVEYTEPAGYEEDDEGNTIIDLAPPSPDASESDFYENLVFGLDLTTLSGIALDLVQKVEWDKTARKKRDEMYAEGIRRTGLGNDAPGGAQFQGASRVVHPMLTQATVEFESRAVKEIFPASGPVKMSVLGNDVPKERWKKAERKATFFNWQLRHQMPEFRPELEKVLTQSPLAGAAYLRFVWDENMKRPTVHSCTTDQVLIPFAATSFCTAERITYLDDITHMEYKERVRQGRYMDAELSPSSMAPDMSRVQTAQNRVEGKEQTGLNEDGLRRVYEINTYLTGIDDDTRALPYIVCIDDTSRKVLSIVRNWEENDEKFARMHWIVEWGFIPWTGAYPIGFIHMIGSLSGAATGALRALLDSAHVNNSQTSAILKGSGISGQSQTIRIGEASEINAGIGADDVRKRVMQLAFNPPSEVLYQLLQFLVQSGESMVRVALDKLAQDNPNMPVGTMYAAIEQGLNVVGAVIGRYYYSMEQSLLVLHRIDRMYITDDIIRDDAGVLLARREDFQGPLDCIPVADPSTPSDAHRHAKIQAVSARAAQVPQLYNMHNVEKLWLKKLLNIPDEEIEELLTPVPAPKVMNAVNENAAATLGRPISAFPEQDHLAHIQTHVTYMESPMFGMLITVMPKFLPIMLQHLTEHIAMWYVTAVYENTQKVLGRDPSEFMKMQHAGVAAELDKTLAMVSTDVVREDAQRALSQLPPIIQRAAQIVQQYQQASAPLDPSQVQRERNQIMAQDSQQKNALKGQELQQRMQQANMQVIQKRESVQADREREMMRAETQRTIAEADQLAESARLRVKEAGNNMRTQQTNETKLEANRDDNLTALSIAKAEIENQENIDLSTGSGINPGTNQ